MTALNIQSVSPRARPLMLAIGLVLTLLGAAYMARVVFVSDAPKDFAYFWIAGRLWLEGANPYAPSFSAAANAMAAAQQPAMEGLGNFHRWLYAPHIWGLSVGLGSFSFEFARVLWGALSGALVLLSGWLTLAAAMDTRSPVFPLAAGLTALLASTTMGTAAMLDTGQFAGFVGAAIAAFAFGILRGHRGALVLSLIVLTLKPSMALPFVAAALVIPSARGPLAIAAVISALLALPPFLTSGPGALITGYLDGLGAYGGYESNSALSSTGLRNLAAQAFGTDLSGLVLAGGAALLAALIGQASLRGGRSPAPDLAVPALAAIIGVTLFLVPMHTYDLALAITLLILVGEGRAVLAIIGALVLLFRPNRLWDIAGLAEPGTKFPGSLAASLVLAALAIGTLALFLYRCVSRGSSDAR